VEKLQELNNPSFRIEKVKARPKIFADPHMDPNYESEDGSDQGEGNILTSGVCYIIILQIALKILSDSIIYPMCPL